MIDGRELFEQATSHDDLFGSFKLSMISGINHEDFKSVTHESKGRNLVI